MIVMSVDAALAGTAARRNTSSCSKTFPALPTSPAMILGWATTAARLATAPPLSAAIQTPTLPPQHRSQNHRI